jgi:hypothetical protein
MTKISIAGMLLYGVFLVRADFVPSGFLTRAIAALVRR